MIPLSRLAKGLGLTALMISLFVLDILTPLAINLGSLYVIPVLLAFYLGNARAILGVCTVCTLLIAFSYSFPDDALAFVRVTNRILAAFAVWVVTFFAFLVKNYQEKLKQTAEELESSNAELDQFASMVSHDLRSHLASIKMSGDLLSSEEEFSEEEKSDVMKNLKKNVRKMDMLIRDLLDFARTSKGSRSFERVDLTGIVQEIETELRHQIAERKARIEVSKMPVIKANPVQMKQLFQNLITNALKYSKKDEPPYVCIESGLSHRGIRLAVRDNGLGFEEKNTEKLFAPFETLHGHREGTGLGLPICRKVVEQHGGYISVKSRPEKGTVFYIDLPRRLLVT